LGAQGRVAELRHLNMTSVRYGLGLSLSIGLLLVCFGSELYTIWLGHKLNEGDIATLYWVTVVMVIPFVFGAPQLVSLLILNGTGKHWYTTNAFIVTAFFSIALSVLLMKYTPLGVYSAAIGWGLRYSINQAILYPFVICKDYKIPLSEYFRRVYFVPLLTTIPIVLFFIVCKVFVGQVSFFNVSLVLISYGLLCAFLVLYVILLPKHRKELFDKITNCHSS
jgi:O-antigen/teichoic acid export membrane protein